LGKDLNEFTRPDGLGWRIRIAEGAAQQVNGRDCGVYTLFHTDLHAIGVEDFVSLNLTIDDIDAFRVKIATDILRGELAYEL